MGTIVNAIAIVVATMIGMVFKQGLPERLKKAIMFMMGLALASMSLGWFIRDFLVFGPDGFETRYDLLIIISLVLGTIIGEILNIDGGLRKFADGVEKKYNLPPVAKGFISGTLIFCVGAMAILGSIQDGLTGDMTTLLFKSVLDFITAMMLASVFGIGVAFAAISVLVYQGLITIGAMLAGQFLTLEMITAIGMVGNIILVAMGINFMELKEVKVANMLPALIIPVVYFAFLGFF